MPLMMFITLIFKSFIPAMVLTVVGTISNVLALNWKKSYLSPWATPADFSFIVKGNMEMKVIYPVISTCSYFVLFMMLAIVYFKRSEQSG